MFSKSDSDLDGCRDRGESEIERSKGVCVCVCVLCCVCVCVLCCVCVCCVVCVCVYEVRESSKEIVIAVHQIDVLRLIRSIYCRHLSRRLKRPVSCSSLIPTIHLHILASFLFSIFPPFCPLNFFTAYSARARLLFLQLVQYFDSLLLLPQKVVHVPVTGHEYDTGIALFNDVTIKKCANLYIYICIYIYMYVCMYVCM